MGFPQPSEPTVKFIASILDLKFTCNKEANELVIERKVLNEDGTSEELSVYTVLLPSYKELIDCMKQISIIKQAFS